MGSPGPATLSLASFGSAYGVKPSVPYLGGIILGTFGVLLLIATGLTGLILAEPKITIVITILASLYILYLAYKIATAPLDVKSSDDISAPAFYSGFILAIANPKAFAAIGAVYSSRTLFEDSVFLDSSGKVLALLFVIIIVNTTWLIAGNLLSSVLNKPKQGRAINICFALLLLVSVGSALLSM